MPTSRPTVRRGEAGAASGFGTPGIPRSQDGPVDLQAEEPQPSVAGGPGHAEGLGDGWLASRIPARADLAAGDHRLLYLAWLHAVGGDEHDDDIPEPPDPAGLGTLPASLRRLVDFLRIDTDLIAAQASPAPAPTRQSRATWRAALATLPIREKDALLLRVMDGDRTSTRSCAAGSPPPADDPTQRPRRTVGEL